MFEVIEVVIGETQFTRLCFTDYFPDTVKPLVSDPQLSGHPLLSGHLVSSRN